MIPDFNSFGVVPPIRPGQPEHSLERSPYPVDLLEVCQRFGTSSERRVILAGLLDLRDALRAAGITDGYQWLNGSFTEDVERLRERPPNDVDVVTFAVLGSAENQEARYNDHPTLFDHDHIKSTYHVDHYLLRADRILDEVYARRIAYWYSMWSHQRETNQWKGFVSVSLTSNDADARAWLNAHTIPAGNTP